MKHTKGPWKTAVKATYGPFAVRHNTGTTIALTCGGSTNKKKHHISAKEEQANARLISISPDMAEMLKEIADQFSNKVTDGKIKATVTLNPQAIKSLLAGV